MLDMPHHIQRREDRALIYLYSLLDVHISSAAGRNGSAGLKTSCVGVVGRLLIDNANKGRMIVGTSPCGCPLEIVQGLFVSSIESIR
jgi:hypothetical protein